MYMCVWDINFAYVTTIFRLYFGIVPTVWYLLFFSLLVIHIPECMLIYTQDMSFPSFFTYMLLYHAFYGNMSA